MIIKDVDFNEVIREAAEAVKLISSDSWSEISDLVDNIGQSITSDIAFIAKKKLSGEFEEIDAKIFLDDQKTVARMRLRSIAIITMKTAERIWNAIIEVFNEATERAIGWRVF